jgi:acyl carrier protein
MNQNKNIEIELRVREVITRTFQLPPASAQNELCMGDPPQWDSMGHMQLVMEVEREFGLTFPTYAMAELTNLPALVNAVAAHHTTLKP